ncbi:MAG: TIGR00282 family metallophosphoesterase [Endomicrobia bacterium]|nr:TIGR00282 family metallophosphoesterase [Endomicrobiia bacterium]
MIKILFIGDIIGEVGRKCVKYVLENKLDKDKYDLIIANGENLAGGKGVSKNVFEEVLSYGIGVVTLGNHTFARKEVMDIISHPKLIRPLNYPDGNPGQGYCIVKTKEGLEVCVINLLGRVFTIECLDCPFRAINKVLDEIREKTKIIIVDFHAEATSEKNALGYFLDGRVSAVLGTHTHVATSDIKIMSNGTGYISDVGMCGPQNSIIGLEVESVLRRFLLGVPQKFNVAKGNCEFNAVELLIDEFTGKCIEIKQIILKDIKPYD